MVKKKNDNEILDKLSEDILEVYWPKTKPADEKDKQYHKDKYSELWNEYNRPKGMFYGFGAGGFCQVIKLYDGLRYHALKSGYKECAVSHAKEEVDYWDREGGGPYIMAGAYQSALETILENGQATKKYSDKMKELLEKAYSYTSEPPQFSKALWIAAPFKIYQITGDRKYLVSEEASTKFKRKLEEARGSNEYTGDITLKLEDAISKGIVGKHTLVPVYEYLIGLYEKEKNIPEGG